MNDLLVTIRCLTYNHEPYIRQCLEGFVMQKTNFRFEAIVHDDASTDNTAAIIREYAEKYPDIIKPIFETENQYSKRDGALRRIMNAHTRGKYVAMCEGDDYWIDPLKLQKQVDFLETHPDYGLVHTLAKVYINNKGLFRKNLIGEDFEGVDQLIIRNRIVTLTTCYRTEIYQRYIQDIKPDSSWKMGDYPFWIYIALRFRVYFLNEITGTYRILENSASNSVDLNQKIAFYNSTYHISSFFAHESQKEYLIPKIKRSFLHSIIYAYANDDRTIDGELVGLIKKMRYISLKTFGLLILLRCRRGRKYLKNRF